MLTIWHVKLSHLKAQNDMPPPSSEQLAEIHSQEIGGIDAAIANNQSRLRVE